MNKIILMGRLTRDPEVRYTADSLAIARYTIAVNRRIRRNGEAEADFISCVAFGKNGEFAEKYFHQGIKVAVTGRIQTGSYTNRDGQKVYTTEVVVEEQEFAESKSAESGRNTNHQNAQEQQGAYSSPGYTPAPSNGQAPVYNRGQNNTTPAPGYYGSNPAGNGGQMTGSNPGYGQEGYGVPAGSYNSGDGFMNIPDGIDEELPFN